MRLDASSSIHRACPPTQTEISLGLAANEQVVYLLIGQVDLVQIDGRMVKLLGQLPGLSSVVRVRSPRKSIFSSRRPPHMDRRTGDNLIRCWTAYIKA